MTRTHTASDAPEMANTKHARDQLKAFVERIERLESEVKDINSDKSDIYQEAKSTGFDVKALKAVIAYRRNDPQAAAEQQLLFETYLGVIEGGTDIALRARTHDGTGSAPPASSTPPAQSTPTPAAAASSASQLSSRLDEAAEATGNTEFPNPPPQPFTEPSTQEGIAGGRPGPNNLGAVLPHTLDPYPDLDIPPILLIGHPDCWRGPPREPPDIRPP